MSEVLTDKQRLWKDWGYQFEYWMPKMQSAPVQLIVSADHSESYEMDRMHLFRLEDKQFALVVEKGCSCYSSSEAEITLASTQKEARRIWNQACDNSYREVWKSEHLS